MINGGKDFSWNFPKIFSPMFEGYFSTKIKLSQIGFLFINGSNKSAIGIEIWVLTRTHFKFLPQSDSLAKCSHPNSQKISPNLKWCFLLEKEGTIP